MRTHGVVPPGIETVMGSPGRSTFTAVLFVFGAILIYSAIKLLKDDDESIDPGKSFAVRLLRKLVPKPLVMTLVHELGVNGKNYIGKLTEEEITRLIKTLKGFTFPITDYAPFEYAIVTAGGVSCAEVNPYTMESLKIRGLYFAGEVLDLDANTGGYNLQIAFSTGRLAGMLKK